MPHPPPFSDRNSQYTSGSASPSLILGRLRIWCPRPKARSEKGGGCGIRGPLHGIQLIIVFLNRCDNSSVRWYEILAKLLSLLNKPSSLTIMSGLFFNPQSDFETNKEVPRLELGSVDLQSKTLTN